MSTVRTLVALVIGSALATACWGSPWNLDYTFTAKCSIMNDTDGTLNTSTLVKQNEGISLSLDNGSILSSRSDVYASVGATSDNFSFDMVARCNAVNYSDGRVDAVASFTVPETTTALRLGLSANQDPYTHPIFTRCQLTVLRQGSVIYDDSFTLDYLSDTSRSDNAVLSVVPGEALQCQVSMEGENSSYSHVQADFTAVPEPTTMFLLILGSSALIPRRFLNT